MDRQPTCKTYSTGHKAWYLDGNLHRTDGPAVEWADGDKEWWLDDKLVPWQMVYHRATSDEDRLSILIAALTKP